jgi:hypothetical protein
MKRDCMFFVADLNMLAAFKGFLCREQFHQSIGCAAFSFDPKKDIRHAEFVNDNLHTQAGELVRGYQTTHKRIVVVQDCAFEGSPGQARIESNLSRQLVAAGWERDDFLTIAIAPELEQWLWQDSPHVETALKHKAPPSLKQMLINAGHWEEGAPKPADPKAAMEWVTNRNRVIRSGATYGKITSKVSVKTCTDAAFLRLVAQLLAWFPAAAGATPVRRGEPG